MCLLTSNGGVAGGYGGMEGLPVALTSSFLALPAVLIPSL